MRYAPRYLVGCIAALAACLLLSPPAQCGVDLELVRGGRVVGQLDASDGDPVDEDTLRVRLPKGAKLSVAVRGLTRGTPRPRVTVTGPNGEELGPDAPRDKGGTRRGRAPLRTYTAKSSGRHTVGVTSGKVAEQYAVTVRWKTPRVTRIPKEGTITVGSEPLPCPFVADAGARATFVLGAPKRSGAVPRLVSVRSTTGNFTHEFAPSRSDRQHVARDVLLPFTGDYVLTYENAGLAEGDLTGRITVRQPRQSRDTFRVPSIKESVALNTGAIGRVGGTLFPARVALAPRLSLRARALTRPTLLRILRAPDIDHGQAGFSHASDALSFEPTDLVLNRPVTVTLELDPGRLRRDSASDVLIYEQRGAETPDDPTDDSVGALEPKRLTVDTETGRVSFDVDRLGTFQLVAPERAAIPLAALAERLVHPDPEDGDHFGASVAIDGSTLVIGVPRDDEAANDVGTAFVFLRQEGSWSEGARLFASDADASDEFGAAVAIHANTLVVGAPRADGGAAYVFTRTGESWTGPQRLVADDGGDADLFGASVAVRDRTILVGAPSADQTTSPETRTSTTTSSEGEAVEVVVDSETLVVPRADGDLPGTNSTSMRTTTTPAPDPQTKSTTSTTTTPTGSVIVKTTVTETVVEREVETSVDVVITATTKTTTKTMTTTTRTRIETETETTKVTAAVTKKAAGAVYVFTRPDDSPDWTQEDRLVSQAAGANARFGRSLALESNVAVIGATGSARVFGRDGDTFAYRHELRPEGADDLFGLRVDVSGDVAIVSAAGAAYVFTALNATARTLQQKLLPPEGGPGGFGRDVAVDGELALVGAAGAPPDTVPGAAYVYTRSEETWSPGVELRAGDDPPLADGFGEVGALSGDTAVIGNPRRDEGGADRGAVHVFVVARPIDAGQ